MFISVITSKLLVTKGIAYLVVYQTLIKALQNLVLI